MGWVKLDDGFPHHPKVVGLSDAAVRAYIESLCYAAQYLTDGIVPNPIAANGNLRDELVAAGLWERLENSVRVHDYLVYNPSREETTALKASRSRAGRVSASTRVATRVLGDGTGGVEVRGGGPGEGFDDFWAAYPRHVGKPKARVAFVAALRRGAEAKTVVAGAVRYRNDPNRSDEFTAHPTTWLNRDGWDDEPLPARGVNPAAEAAAREHERKVAEARRIAREG